MVNSKYLKNKISLIPIFFKKVEIVVENLTLKVKLYTFNMVC